MPDTRERKPGIVIIGMGQAGAWAAHTLRAEGYTGGITMLGAEGHTPYERPPLSKAVLLGKCAPESTKIFTDEAFAALNIDAYSADPAAQLDRGRTAVITKSGIRVPYERVLFCSGGRPRALTACCETLPSVHVLRTLRDCSRLSASLTAKRSLVAIGGGWIGLEVAAAARSKGLDVTVIEAAPLLCQRSVPASVSTLLRNVHERAGVRIFLEAFVESIQEASDNRTLIRLRGGVTIAADILVVAVGILPNTELAERAGIAVDGGIIVDHRCCSSDPNVFAAGDVAVAPNSWAQRRIRLESWQNAQDQAIAAARAALGLKVHYDPVPWFWSDQFDLKIQIAGIPGNHLKEVRRPLGRDGALLHLYLQGDLPMAAVAVNAPKEMGAVKRLLQQRLRIPEAILADRTVDLQRLTQRKEALTKIV